ncbi:hypothetical protein [Antrihabitans cavernicola]|uniref:MFS transporter n=1 Tax=Antrihabitans cavernicola TaxID=2495913 RepID=A0A5A7SAG2_9NOCA|nr:hypothetical protein [Spelaeibacter cavernicola]KAA0022172.1 hypothetical protein FOY51_14330 [Spelaeibacter cavernicola]
MPPILRELITLVAGLFGAGLAGFVLADARSGNWAFIADPAQLERWHSSAPSGVAIGVVVAVLVCILIGQQGSSRGAWVAVAVFSLIVGIITAIQQQFTSLDVVTALHYVRAVAAGGILGAVIAALWARAPGRLAVSVGAVSAFLLAKAWNSAGAIGGTRIGTAASQLGDPPSWLSIAAILLAVAAAWTAQTGFRLQRPDPRSLRVVIVGAIVLALAHRLLGQWIGNQEYGSRIRIWVVIAISLVIVLASVELIARFAPAPDGRFLLAATGCAAAAMPVLGDFASATISGQWIILVGVLAVVVGLRLSVDRPHPVAGLAVAALIPLVTAAWPTFGNDGVLLLVRVAVLGFGIAHAVGSTFPTEPAIAALGLGIPFSAFVLTEAASVPLRFNFYGGSYEPLSDTYYSPLPGVTSSDAFSTSLSIEFTEVSNDLRFVGIALLLTVVFCAAAILVPTIPRASRR